MKAATITRHGIQTAYDISIHAAREGGDLARQSKNNYCVEFQSTPPVKAATITLKIKISLTMISIHAAREGGDLKAFAISATLNGISIHAAREGGDDEIKDLLNEIAISIHAAREGGDHTNKVNFYRI